MAIEFNCPSCAKLLRTPDESAGKRAKCPQCGTIVQVPGTRQPPESDPLASPGGFGPIDSSFPGPETVGPFQPTKSTPFDPPTTNPYASPSPAGTYTMPGAGVHDQGGRFGLPWERLQKSAKTFWETSKLIFSSPTEAFSIMMRTGGLGTPIGFLVIGGLIGGLFSGIYNTILQVVMMSVVAAGGENMGGPEMAVPAIQIALALPMAIIGGTVGALIGSFISAAIYHVCLMMLGGAQFGFETTYRVVAYVNGAVALLQVIPLCGQYVFGIVGLVYMILGISAAHQISGGKAAAAVLLPLIVCCGGALILIGGLVGAGIFAANQ